MAKQGNTGATHHATKCSSLFQVLAARRLHRAGMLHDSMHEVRGPALKQTEKGPQYKTRERENIMSLLAGTRATGSMPSQQADSLSSASKVPETNPPLPAREEGFASAGSACLLGPPGQGSNSGFGATQGGLFPANRVVREEPPSGEPTRPVRDRTTIRLVNPHNLCYMNSGVLAALHAIRQEGQTHQIRALRTASVHIGQRLTQS